MVTIITNRREAVDIMILHMVIISPIMTLHTDTMNLIMTYLMVIMNLATIIMKHHMDIMQKLGDLWNSPRTAELFQEQGHLNRLRSLVFEDTSQTIPGAAV